MANPAVKNYLSGTCSACFSWVYWLMIKFPQLANLSSEPVFSAADVLNGVSPPRRRSLGDGRLWAEFNAQGECIRFFGANIGRTGSIPLIFLEGDVLQRGNHPDATWTVPERYCQLSPSLMQAEAEQYAIATGRTFLNLARPGVYGSSGNHSDRRREREVVLVNDAVDRLKDAFGWDRIDLAGLSGGGHLVAALMARRSDINCAVIASGNVSIRQRNAERGLTTDVTGHTDFIDPIDLVLEVSQHPPRKIIVLTDPQDVVVSAATQIAYVNALRNLRVHVEHRFMPAADPRHHFLRFAAILAAVTWTS